MKPVDASEQTIFDAARQIPDTLARAAYLATACAGDANLRERIERLLQAGQRADEFLAENPLGALTPSLSPSDGEREKGRGVEGPGTIIGNYKLLEKLGEGGFGVVYMAEQKQPIKRRVALKIIKVGMDTREVVARFEAERQALAMMDHPNIAKVFDAGATDSPHPQPLSHPMGEGGRRPGEGQSSQSAIRNPQSEIQAGRPYFVMELVRGIKITDYCDEKNLSTRERLDLFTQVCQAVQHAHQKGIIHRDLKPSNILVTVNDGVAVPKIIDFGIAKATQLELTEKTVFTRFHQFLGTPAYMSPEQTELTSVDIDTRSDIYSLGVLLYELLTGKTPFDTNELLKAGLDELRRTIREVEPVKPSTRLTMELTTVSARRSLKGGKGEREKRGTECASRSESPSLPFSSAPFPPRQPEDDEISLPRLNQLKQLIPALRGDLDWIVMKCLEKDRARRYETANGLATDIQRHLNNEAVVACPPSKLYKLQKLVQRNKLAFAAGSGIAAALVIGLAAALWQSIQKTRAYNRAVTAEKAAQTEAAKSQQVAQYLEDLLQDLGPSVALVHDPAMVRGILDRAAERIDRDLANQPETAIELRATVAAIYGELGLVDRMAELSRKNLDLARSTFGAENLVVANALSQLGEAEMWREKPEEAEVFIREALRMRRRLLDNEHLDVARSLLQLGEVLNNRADPLEVEAVYRQGLAICWKRPGDSALVESDLLSGLALALLAVEMRQSERIGEAEALSRRALAIKRNLPGEHPSVGAALNVLGLVLFEEDKLAEAEAVYREALAVNQRFFGREHYLVAHALAGLGTTLAAEGKLVEGETILREALVRQTKAFGNEKFELTHALFYLARVLERQGKLAEAESIYREVVAIHKRLSRNSRGSVLLELATVLRKQGKRSDADVFLLDAIAAFRKQADDGEIDSQNTLAWLLATQPDPQLRGGQSAVFYAEKAVTATSRTNAGYLDTLAAAYAESGDFSRAISVQKEAITLNKNRALNGKLASRLKLYESGSPYRDRE